MRRSSAMYLFSAAVAACSTGDTHGRSGAVTDRGVEALIEWDALPQLHDRWFETDSSYDRGTQMLRPFRLGEKDFNNFIAVCGDRPAILGQEVDGVAGCASGLEGYLIASDDSGPGFVSRLFVARGELRNGVIEHALRDERIRVYVDDLTQPAYEGRLGDWIAGDGPFAPPAVTWVSGALTSAVPISYGSKLRILLDGLEPRATAYFVQVDRQRVDQTAPFSLDSLRTMTSTEGRAFRTAFEPRTLDPERAWADAATTIPPGGTLTLLDRDGPGTVEALSLVLDPGPIEVLDGLTLRAFWETDTAPAVEISLASLSGARLGSGSVETLPLSVHPGSHGDLEIRLFLPMPFSSHARIALEGPADRAVRVIAHVEGSPRTPALPWGHFHARENDGVSSVPAGEPCSLAEIHGRGTYVGTSLYVVSGRDPTAAVQDPMNALECDPVLTVDGRVVQRGTGTEEYFDGGWYFVDGAYSTPFGALVARESDEMTGVGRIAAIRWHVLAGAIPFRESFRLDVERGAIDRSYSSASFYYLGDE